MCSDGALPRSGVRWIAGRGAGSWSEGGGRLVAGGMLACIFERMC
jgi:hypothetical protein